MLNERNERTRDIIVITMENYDAINNNNNNERIEEISRKFIVTVKWRDAENIYANCELTFIWSLNIYTFFNIYSGDNIHNIHKQTHTFTSSVNTAVVKETMSLVEPAALNWTPLLKRSKFLHIKNGV